MDVGVGDGPSALVIGGAGFLGAELVGTLLAAGWVTAVLGRNPPDRVSGADRIIRGDARDPSVALAACAGVDVVFHLAGTSSPAAAERDPVTDLAVHTHLAVTIGQAARLAGVRRLVHLSSGGTVYGRDWPGRPWQEEDPANPIAAIGIRSRHVERVLLDIAPDPVILRVANAYGSGQPSDGDQGLVAIATARIRGGQAINLFGSGNTVRDFVAASDVARAAANAATRGGPYALVNVGTGIGTSVADLIGLIAAELGRPAVLNYAPARPFDVERNVLDIERARSQLDWEPRVELRTGLKALVGQSAGAGVDR